MTKLFFIATSLLFFHFAPIAEADTGENITAYRDNSLQSTIEI